MWILTNWKLILLGTALAATMVFASLWRAAIAQRDLARADLANYKQAAEAAATTAKAASDRALKEINDEIPRLVEQAKNNAWKNFQARYGMGNAACGIRADGLFPRDPVHHGEARSTESINGLPIQEFVAACAADAGIIEQWKQWAKLNELKSKD